MDILNEEAFIENLTFDELNVGRRASLTHLVTQRDLDLFSTMTGDINPALTDPSYDETGAFQGAIIHSMWGAGLIATLLGTKLPGPGTVYLGQDLRFLHPVHIGDAITATLTMTSKDASTGEATLDCHCSNQAGKAVIEGEARVRVPVVKIRRTLTHPPEVLIARHGKMDALIAKARSDQLVPTAIVHPIDAASLSAALHAGREGLITPVLIGPRQLIEAAARAIDADLSSLTLIDAPDARSSAETAVALARSGKVSMLMKGDLHTDDLMHAVIASETGLRTASRISHVFVMDVPEHPRLLIITDAAINIVPTLAEKAGIVQNAIDVAHVMGISEPKVAILAAVETVNDRMASTIHAAALCKMAERGQIKGGLLDGPLGFDNAVSEDAAREKGLHSTVAGHADILLVPDLEAGNMLAKQLTFLSGAVAAGLVLGASIPIVLTSRADSAATRLASCALGVLVSRRRDARHA